ncbi:putative membrane-bound dehydrogenase domain-containing protein [Cyclobacterium lianum]|uniref:Putative membrane-bound dehydrogenase domain-containing protein n=1 Tax=Cyclobacterium lianum TaxID=388280 RepID=A0A1M7MKX1_9BACT|nr:PVC-type heme-binding CxxCH protein [Cyclobacterium lianum]SHM91673.1 putative membrane-bound dehydrogenase domain-containing protein [Cyclobacterium lianum]
MRIFHFIILSVLVVSCGPGGNDRESSTLADTAKLEIIQDETSGQIQVFRRDLPEKAILVQEARKGFRPYIHPILAPDGSGLLTQYSPGHHKHQTGLYWGFTQVNGRDYFHHPGESHWKKIAANVIQASGETVAWQTVYEMLDSLGQPLMTETQNWSLTLNEGKYFLDLEWTGQAETAVNIGKYDYGGLFLRMPWSEGIDAEVINTARQKNEMAEGQPSMWLNIGMQVPDRDNRVNIALFDHPDNKGYPQKWRVDGQFGVGPAYTRDEDWEIAAGEELVLKHRLLVYTDEFQDLALTDAWGQYTGNTGMYNTTALWRIAQEEGRKAKFLSPDEAVAEMTVKPGFEVNVFAAEPMITQPMAFCWDDQGRLWVAENRDYESRGHGFSNAGDSRILILEDSDGDGIADSKKVFMEGLAFPAALAVGFDGVYVGAPPNLLFIPDKDGDDKADEEDIEVLLTGWGIRDRHETLNSLHWGPDGWLYGLQGFATPSKIRKPAGAEKKKLYYHKDRFPENLLEGEGVDINGGVWRYHPTKNQFEVVAHGFSNPWGIDYDSKGQLIMSACVIPHLWHVVPGGIYHRQGGQHFNPYVYEDIKTITDHSHRSAHGGARIYQSDAFPEEEHGKVFMANIHEHAVLTDKLVPDGSGFSGQHGDDFLLANNAQWVGFSMEIGPEGGVYVLDWHDADICGQEVLHGETGRIFRIMPEQSGAENWEGRYQDLNNLSDLELVKLQTSNSDWHSRRARGILQKRAAKDALKEETMTGLKDIFDNNKDPDYRLRALWALHQINGLQDEELVSLLEDSDPYVRAWGIQLLCEDKNPPARVREKFRMLAETDPAATVRLYLAAALQRVPEAWKWEIAAALMQREEDQSDHNIPKMIWFGTEQLIETNPEKFLELASSSNIPLLTRFMARRAVDEDLLADLVSTIQSADQNKIWLLEGMLNGMEGRTDLEVPANWKQSAKQLEKNDRLKDLSARISARFGDAAATQKALHDLRSRSETVETKIRAIQMLSAQQKQELTALLPQLLDDRELRLAAIKAVANYNNLSLGERLVDLYPGGSEEEKTAILQSLSSRSVYGNLLMQQLQSGNISKKEIPVTLARQLHRVIGSGFVEVWGPIEHVPNDREAYENYRKILKSKALQSADLAAGKNTFMQSCGSCHKMFGEGADIGPDLTGSNRQDPEYILLNVLEPSAEIQDAYRLVIITTLDGRTYTGNVVGESPRQITLKIAGQDPVQINKSNIQNKETTDLSLMPPGLFEPLSDQELINLMAYLQSPRKIE